MHACTTIQYVLGLPALHLLVMLHVVTNVVLNLQVDEGIVLTQCLM